MSVHQMYDTKYRRWPPPATVACALSQQQVASGVPELVSGLSQPNQEPLLPPPHSFPRTQTDSEVQAQRDDALKYLERKKANIPNVGKPVKVKFQEGFEDMMDQVAKSHVGYYLGKFATEHDLANVPRMPEDALRGVVEDEWHDRTSYNRIVDGAIDFARTDLPKGKRVGYYVIDSDTDDDRKRHTVIPKQRPSSNDFMYLVDTDHEHNDKNKSAPPALAVHEARQRAQSRTIEGIPINMEETAAPEKYPRVLKPGRAEKRKAVSFQVQETASETELEVDYRIPVTQPYKAETYHGIEQEKSMDQPKRNTVQITDSHKIYPAQTAEEAVHDQHRYAGAALRPNVLRSTSGTNIEHIFDAHFLNPESSPEEPTNEIYRRASTRTRKCIRKKKKNRSGTVMMAEEDAAKLKACGNNEAISTVTEIQSPCNQSPGYARGTICQQQKIRTKLLEPRGKMFTPQARSKHPGNSPTCSSPAGSSPQLKRGRTRAEIINSCKSTGKPHQQGNLSLHAVMSGPIKEVNTGPHIEEQSVSSQPTERTKSPPARYRQSRPQAIVQPEPQALAPSQSPVPLTIQAVTRPNQRRRFGDRNIAEATEQAKRRKARHQQQMEATEMQQDAKRISQTAHTQAPCPLPKPHQVDAVKPHPLRSSPPMTMISQPALAVATPQAQAVGQIQAVNNTAFASHAQRIEPVRTLNQYHRQSMTPKASFPGPTKFGETHLIDPAVDRTKWLEEARMQSREVCRERERNRRRMERGTDVLETYWV